MAIRIFEFKCSDGHISEKFIDEQVLEIECPVCSKTATRIISSPRFMLEGITGAFPTAYDQWARKHEQAARAGYKKNEELYRSL